MTAPNDVKKRIRELTRELSDQDAIMVLEFLEDFTGGVPGHRRVCLQRDVSVRINDQCWELRAREPAVVPQVVVDVLRNAGHAV